MNLLAAFAVGLVSALLASLPMGPLSFRVIQMALTQGRRAAMAMGIGGLVVEMLFCLIALGSLQLILGSNAVMPDQEALLDDLYPFTIPILLVMGILAIVNRDKVPNPNQRGRTGGPMLLGIVLCISNPALLTTWVLLTTWLKSLKLIGESLAEDLMFILGVGSGVFLFYYIITGVATRSHRSLGPIWRRRINVGFGVFFISFAIYLGIRFLSEL